MVNLVARGTLAALVLCASVALAGLGWLLYQPGGGDESAYEAFMSAYQRDPSHAAIYARAYELLVRATDGDAQHYVAHRAVATLARATGHGAAAREQEWRASQHRL